MKALRRIRPGLWITLTLATLSVAYTLLVFLPRQREIMQAHAEMNTKSKFIVETTRLLATIDSSEKQLDKAQEHIAAFNQLTIPESKIADVYASISQLAEKTEMVIVRFSPSTAVKMNSIQRIPITIACRAKYASLASFLTELEKLPQATWIDTLRINRSEPDVDELDCDFTLTIFVDETGFAEST